MPVSKAGKWYYTQEQYRDAAKDKNALAYAKSRGYGLISQNGYHRMKEHDSLVFLKDGRFFWNSRGIGPGGVLDFMIHYEGMTVTEAVLTMARDPDWEGHGRSTPYLPSSLTQAPVQAEKKAPFALPKPNRTMLRVYGYLLGTRCLDKDVLDTFVARKMIYESADYHNAVFVGYDKSGIPRHGHLRGTLTGSGFRGNIESSLPEWSFHWQGPSRELYLFEAPIDMLSYISLHKEHWQRHSYAAGCGVSSHVMRQMLKDDPGIRKVYLCHDNDSGGNQAVARISAELRELGIEADRLCPQGKDWNDDLQALRAPSQERPSFSAEMEF